VNTAVQIAAMLEEAKRQWQASARLRWGSWAVLFILALYALQLGFDHVDAQREHLKTLDGNLSRLRTLAKENVWPARAKEASDLSSALTSMAWGEADLALTEAAFQDWLRTIPGKLGLKTRELNIVRVEDAKPGSDFARPVASDGAVAALSPPPGHVVLRARISFELQRAPLMNFLAECARSERSIVVERLSLRTLSQPQVAELDLRILARRDGANP